MDVKVEKGEVLDGIGKHYSEKVKISDKFLPTIHSKGSKRY